MRVRDELRLLASATAISLVGSLVLGANAPAAEEATTPAPALTAEQVEFFESRIRPVLIERCYECHAGEAETIKGGLRLDYADGWRKGGDSGPAVLPGKPDESLLIQALRYETYEMPPDGQLPARVIADFERWVRMGAPDPRTEAPSGDVAPRPIDLAAGREFWSFRPLAAAPTPAVRDANWPRTWIDRFILAAQESQGLTPSPDAPAETLLRRLSFDLTGLPPTVEELREFRAAAAADLESALAAAVDRLLESPHFGIHWGRHWLDVARYADSNGGDFNATFHDAWRYRDYVIRVYNEDRPFDRFIREQIAGDLLPFENDAQREEQLVATGFLALGPKMLSERDKDKLRMDVVDEQINSVGQAFLGMTLGCARCHDHKFDPIPTEDYYALAGIFRSTLSLEGEIQKYVSNFTRQPLPIDPEHAAALARHRENLRALEQELTAARKKLDRLKESLASSRLLGILVDDAQAQKVGEWKSSTHVPRFIGEGYIHDDKQSKGRKSVAYVPQLPAAGEYEVRFAFASGGGRDRKVPVRIRHAQGETVVYVDQSAEPPIEKLFVPLGRFPFEAGDAGSVTVSTEGTTEYVIADAVQFIPVAELDGGPPAAAPQLQAEQEALEAEIKRLEGEKKSLQAAAPPREPTALAVKEASDIGDCPLCIRGEHNRPGRLVPRGVLQVVPFADPPEFPANESGRRQLADWIADPRHPLTARVYVNRVWAHLLGEGLVRTVDNFGRLGDPPSHPELLDRLAADFIAHGWSTKALIRQIVLSRVYRQQAHHREEEFLRDPENRLLWRAHRKRLPAEAIRDTLLLVSGGLETSCGGSPVEGLGTLVTDNSATAQGYQAGESARRSVYLPIIRNELPTMLSAFDFADPDFVTGRRSETNVPAQALVLLNSPFVRDVARQTAERLAREASGDDAGRVIWLYEAILSRPPAPTEVDRAMRFVESLRNDHPDDSHGVTPWSRLAHVLYASTEFRLLD